MFLFLFYEGIAITACPASGNITVASQTDNKRIFENYRHHTLVLFFKGDVNPMPANFYKDTGTSSVSRTAETEIVRNALNFVIKNGHYVGGVHPKTLTSPARDALNLSPRQAQVFELLKRRIHYSFICELLDISVNTYRQYRQQINERLKVAGFAGIKEFIKKENQRG